ncbi:MAG: UDP-N-acetylglucosamine 1-carboxyvinyltransferase, partial [Thermodesulfobacteriota bacterium]
MDKIVIEGGNRLVGEVEISGAKNAALPLMAASLLTEGTIRLTNVPRLRDIETFLTLLRAMGVKCETKDNGRVVELEAVGEIEPTAQYELVKTMRASILVLGPLLARFKSAKVSLPGGCAIGARPINLHLVGLEKMGANIKIEHGYVLVSAEKLKGAKIYLDAPTVTGTENLMLAAVFADGVTVLENAAMEPEVVCLADMLNMMGANITGAGTDTIRIEGIDEARGLKGVEFEVIPDRIEAGTFMVASAMTKGNVLLKNCPIEYLETLSLKLRECGTDILKEEDGVRVIGDFPIRSVDIRTHAYPGFPTDMQAQMMSMMSIASGLSVIVETVFENRFMHIGELKRMGADITVDGRSAIVKGVNHLSGARLMATDLRASASLILAGLVADGWTSVSRI